MHQPELVYPEIFYRISFVFRSVLRRESDDFGQKTEAFATCPRLVGAVAVHQGNASSYLGELGDGHIAIELHSVLPPF